MSNRFPFLRQPSQSLWLASCAVPERPALREDQHADVCIVGGGIAGIMTAFQLAGEGVRVVLLEADRLLGGTTGHTTAKLTSQHELIYTRTRSLLGAELAGQYARANQDAIELVHTLIGDLGIACGWSRQRAFVYAQQPQSVAKIEEETLAASALGLPARYVEDIPLEIPIKAAVCFEEQAQFHPVQFLSAIATDAERRGARLYEHARAVELSPQSGGYALRTADGFTVTADRVVIASHYPFYNKPSLFFTRLRVERSYIVAVQARETYPGGMYINCEEPTRSVRAHHDGQAEWILCGGESLRTGQNDDTESCYAAIRAWADDLFTVQGTPLHWSAQDPCTLDGIPYVGRYSSDDEGLYVATGFGKWGMSNGVAASTVLRDLIVRGESPCAPVYDPARGTVMASAGNFVAGAANVAFHLVRGKVSPVPAELDVPNGEGRVVELSGERMGVYRDDGGALHLVDTTCPHMGCELNWNAAERSWDCPCHGSRFSVDGQILEGPALDTLNNGN
jgi:glycine/D-amino acid oxidase-like deaminating enzyme/nitrite reductase/ring-hydroxylating ferredoxin subunit